MEPQPTPRFANRREWHSHRRSEDESARLALVDDGRDRYRGLFENSPTSLWEEDFSELKAHLDVLRDSGVVDLRAYARQHPEEVVTWASKVTVVDVNEATLELLGCDAKERLLGRLPRFFRRESYDLFLEEVLALAGGAAVFEADAVNHTLEGRPIDVRVRLSLSPGHERSWSKVFISLTDIGDLKRAQSALELHRVAMESCADAIVITRRDGVIEWANKAFLEMSGFALDELVGATPRLLKSGRHDDAYYREMWETVTRGEPYRNRTINRHKSGRLYTVEQTITPIAGERGEITHFVAVQQDISDRLESEERLVQMAQSDFLTGLPNRYTFTERLEREAIRSWRRGRPVSLLLLDVDHFKDVNDLFGHPIGDALLVQIAQRLKQGLRTLDTVARLGGDEFAVLQTDAGEPDATAVLAQRLIGILEKPFSVEGYTLTISASVGVALARPGEVKPEQMIRQADLALYRAKHRGRGTYRFHDDEMDREVHERVTLGRDLRRAIDRDELHLVYQPQIEIASGRICGLEALLRWEHPERGPVPPDRFIPMAENNGFIVPLGEWVLRTACRDFTRLRGIGSRDGMRLAVNISAVQMRSADFADMVLAVLDESGVEPAALVLEITESVLVKHTRSLTRSIEALERAGVRFSIDDFGRGYSSMAYLRQSWVDQLKIDRAFLDGVDKNPSDAAIVTAIIALANKLGIRVLAEGVERRAQVDFLRDSGCDELQGYYFSRPVPEMEIGRLLETDRRAGPRRLSAR